jgi:acyl transferase domain-containing protein/acyl carrier protein/SAM-dependent methyltransferase
MPHRLPSHGASLGLIFGPQAMNFDSNTFTTLRAKLVKDRHSQWAIDAIATLPAEWSAVSGNVAIFKQYDAGKALQNLNEWLKTGHVPPADIPFCNVLLAPMVVIDHLISYLEFLQSAFPDLDDDEELPASAKESLETLGLSLGTLSAFAVSTSSTLSEVKKHGATAIRLAMLVGAVGDAEDLARGPEEGALSFSAFWKSTELHDLLHTSLDAIPEAYISVAVDEKRSTITTSRSKASSHMQDLRSSGLYIAEVSIRGRFHWDGHESTLQELIQYCDRNLQFQFPDPSRIVLPSHSVTGGEYITQEDGSLHAIALRAILVDLSQWLETITGAYGSDSSKGIKSVICFGPERCVPSALVRRLGSKLTHVLDVDLPTSALPKQLLQSADVPSTNGVNIPASIRGQSPARQHPIDIDANDDKIAVIGMACNVPGGEDMDEFWKILVAGKSQHEELPRGTGRFEFETPWREPYTKTKWYGNFIKDYDVFDHKFFKKGPREMLNTEPQHRLLLHAAYQTLEQSGYFSKPDYDKHIACFLGPGHVDYASSVNCYAPNAYTATGNLKSMCAGKISHHFGWTGPILTLDTACSSSCVAIHYACRSILSGEVSAALAGGSNVLSSVEWYENLSGAQFLSPTGQCKPFDAKADGYCRGDGIGLVFLKKLSTALADGDQVYGVIAGSKVYQNVGSTTITVPNADSLATLFKDITKQARIDPAKVSVVEAHGTGTPVGDPAEYEAICRIFGGSQRTDVLSLSSVKGLFGHTEGASGVCSLLKVLLMMHENAIPPQASFGSMNPGLKATTQDNIEVPTRLTPWKPNTQIALINNYGASGSNSSLVVTEPPAFETFDHEALQYRAFPFWIPGLDDKSIQRYAARLRAWFQRHHSSSKDLSMRNMSFQLAFQSNRTLPQALVFKAASVSDLESKLKAFENGTLNSISSAATSQRPVILCFGGQISTYIGLDREVYENVAVLRQFLDQCDETSVSLGFPSVFPHIFQKEPIYDLIKLQLALFAMQYSCAQAWIACGVEVAAVVGHSFGELTASCVSGTVSLQDAITMIAGRARLIQKKWGTDSGAMIAVDAELSGINDLLAKTREGSGADDNPSIACYNGHRSFTLAGTTKSIEQAESILKQDAAFSSTRWKRLNVTNAFHSVLVDSLHHDLQSLGKRIVFNEPKLHFERSTKESMSGKPNSDYIAHHMRNPVYFDHAVQRLAKDFPAAIWLEAGSNSTITSMANRALSSSAASSTSSFHAVSITTDKSFDLLVDATLKLWKEQLNVSFWAHHRSQTHQYTPMILPPYQFEKSRHWLETKPPPKPEPIPVEKSTTQAVETPKGFTSFAGYIDGNQRSLRYRINSNHETFQRHVNGHICAKLAAVWPSSIQIDMVLDALMNLRAEFKDLSYQPQISNIVHHRPLLLDNSKDYWLELVAKDDEGLTWDWNFSSSSGLGSKSTICTSGVCSFCSATDPNRLAEFQTLERLSSRRRCVELLEARDVENIMQGTANIYRAFSEVIEYTDDYRYVKKLVGHNNESAARVVKKHYGKTWLDYLLFDGLGQTAGMYVNLMADKANVSEKGIFMCETINRWLRSPSIRSHESLPTDWEVYAVHHPISDKKYVSDIFSFDARDGSLVEVVLGASYNKVPLPVMRGILGSQSSTTRLDAITANAEIPSQAGIGSQQPHLNFKPLSALPALSNGTTGTENPQIKSKTNKVKKVSTRKSGGSDLETPAKTRNILENLTGVEASSINDSSNLIDLGLDSLLSMELIRDVEDIFKVDLDAEQMLDLTDFASLVKYIREIRGVLEEQNVDDSESESEELQQQATPVDSATRQNHEKLTMNGTGLLTNGESVPEVPLDSTLVLDAFRYIKEASDDFIVKNKFETYCAEFMPRSEEVSIAIFCNAFEELGCPIRTATAGTRLERVQHLPKHKKVVDYIYKALEKNAGLIEISGEEIIRTSVPCPSEQTEAMLESLLHDRPAQDAEIQLMRITGAAFGKCLAGKADVLPLLFGSIEGRALLTKLYATSTLSNTILQQLEVFVEKIGSSWPKDGGPLRILEVGAGTGGTTTKIVPVLARLGIPVEYTMTDVSSFFTATGRTKFKEYPFMKFKTVDIEKEPDAKLLKTQHIVLGSNVIHATRVLSVSLSNIHKMLRPDGLIIYHELTSQLLWADIIFGLVEGWWLFEDGRDHALQSPQHWEKILRSVGYGHVDWTDGTRPEAKIQNLIFAMASDPTSSSDR